MTSANAGHLRVSGRFDWPHNGNWPHPLTFLRLRYGLAMTPDYRPSLLRSFERHLRAENRSDNTIESYLESIRQAEAFLAARGRTLLDARRAELVGLRLADLDLDLDVALVLGKGRRERALPFGRKTAVALDRYLRVRARHRDAELSWLWLGQRSARPVRRPADPSPLRPLRVHGCVAVQHALAQAGISLPAPPGRLRTGRRRAALHRGGIAQRSAASADQADSAKLFAGLLAELIALAPPVASVPSLAPSPPWVGWDRTGPKLWPEADDRDQDLNQHPGPSWLDDLAMRVRARLVELALPLVVGHGDWESQNIRWRGRRPWVVHDWDSTVAQPEAAIAGQAAAVWPAAGGP
jgi:hypothetical protein